MNTRIAELKGRGQIEVEESKMPAVRLSTKDQLAQLGINVNMSDAGNSMLGSDDGEGYDQFDVNMDHLESEEEDILA